MAEDAFQLPEAWRHKPKALLKLKCFPRGTEDCPRPYIVFVVVFPRGYEHMVSSRCFVKYTARLMLDHILKMFHGELVPDDIKRSRSQIRSRINRYKSVPEIGGSGVGARGCGSTGRSHMGGTH